MFLDVVGVALPISLGVNISIIRQFYEFVIAVFWVGPLVFNEIIENFHYRPKEHNLGELGSGDGEGVRT